MMADCDSDSVHSGDSSVLLCIGEPFFGSLTNLDGFGKIRGRCTNPLHNCSCYVRFEHQLSFACLNCQGLCPAFSHVSGNDSVLWALNLELLFQYCGKYLLDILYQFFKKTKFLVEFFFLIDCLTTLNVQSFGDTCVFFSVQNCILLVTGKSLPSLN